MQEVRVRSVGWEDPLEKEMSTDSCTLAWKIPWTEKPLDASQNTTRDRHVNSYITPGQAGIHTYTKGSGNTEQGTKHVEAQWGGGEKVSLHREGSSQ